MNKRDKIIDNKLSELKSKKEALQKTLNEIEKPLTSLMLNYNGHEIYNLRTISNVDKLYEVYSLLHKEVEQINKFNIDIVGEYLPMYNIDYKIYGYPWHWWLHDIKDIYIKIVASSKLNEVNKAINEIEKYYSGDRKEENAFNELLSNIDQL